MRSIVQLNSTGVTAVAVAALLMTSACGSSGGLASLGGGLTGTGTVPTGPSGQTGTQPGGSGGSSGSSGAGGSAVAAGSGGVGTVPETGGPLTRATGLLAIAGNLPVSGQVDQASGQGDSLLNPLARATVADQPALGPSSGDSQQLLGIGAASTSQPTGTLATVGAASGGAAGLSAGNQLLAANLSGNQLVGQSNPSLVGANLLTSGTPQGTLLSVGVPANGTVTGSGLGGGALSGVTGTVNGVTGNLTGGLTGGLTNGAGATGALSGVTGLVPGL